MPVPTTLAPFVVNAVSPTYVPAATLIVSPDAKPALAITVEIELHGEPLVPHEAALLPPCTTNQVVAADAGDVTVKPVAAASVRARAMKGARRVGMTSSWGRKLGVGVRLSAP
ncbi:hypothetical protein GCM10022234_09490 [Aeromicrobium panaciterrae]